MVYFLVYFLVYITLQMTVQAFMIVATGREIYEENLHFHNASSYSNQSTENPTSCLPVKVSVYLWCMIVMTYLLPVVGLLMFFLIGYYWVEEFFITVYIQICENLKSIAKSPGIDTIFQIKEKADKMNQSFSKILSMLPRVEEDFEHFKRVPWCTKFGRPFKSPALVIACITFLLLNCLFISFSSGIATISPFVLLATLLDSTGWTLVYLAGSVFGIAANAYTFLVAIVWLIIIEIIIFLICALWPCCCYILYFWGKSDAKQN